MIKRPNTNAQRLKRHKRVRAKISGTPGDAASECVPQRGQHLRPGHR